MGLRRHVSEELMQRSGASARCGNGSAPRHETSRRPLLAQALGNGCYGNSSPATGCRCKGLAHNTAAHQRAHAIVYRHQHTVGDMTQGIKYGVESVASAFDNEMLPAIAMLPAEPAPLLALVCGQYHYEPSLRLGCCHTFYGVHKHRFTAQRHELLGDITSYACATPSGYDNDILVHTAYNFGRRDDLRFAPLPFAKIVKGECRDKRKRSFQIWLCRAASCLIIKIVKGECRVWRKQSFQVPATPSRSRYSPKGIKQAALGQRN